MLIILKNKDTLCVDDFRFKCVIGKNGTSKNKVEGDKKTPIGTFSLGPLYFRNDRNKKIDTNLKIIKIKKNMGWCDDVNYKKYNKPIKIKKKIKHEKMFRTDHKYDYVIPIKYNFNNPKKNKGSAIFIHLTSNYKKTLGCVALNKNDMIILLKIIKKDTKIKIT